MGSSSRCSWPWNSLSTFPRTRCHLITDASHSSSSQGPRPGSPVPTPLGAHTTQHTDIRRPGAAPGSDARPGPLLLPPAGTRGLALTHLFPGSRGLHPRGTTPPRHFWELSFLREQTGGSGRVFSHGPETGLAPDLDVPRCLLLAFHVPRTSSHCTGVTAEIWVPTCC